MVATMTTVMTGQRHLHHRTDVWLMNDAGIAVDVFPRLFILLTATDTNNNITVSNTRLGRKPSKGIIFGINVWQYIGMTMFYIHVLYLSLGW